jgi:hypothetical protein
MRLKLTSVMLGAVMVITALYHARTAHATPVHAQERGCSFASLKGGLCLPQDGREQCRDWSYRPNWHRRL